MPEKKVTVTYLCEICTEEHNDRESALECEKRGVAIPEFKRHEVVEFVGLSGDVIVTVSSGFRVNVQNGTKGVVHDAVVDNDKSFDPHRLLAYYEVWIRTVGGTYKKELAAISREDIRKVTVRDGALCPLCESSTGITKDVSGPVLNIGDRLPFLRNVPMRKCSDCDVEFFTTQQSKRVGLLIKKETRWPLANTQRLVREDQFQF